MPPLLHRAITEWPPRAPPLQRMDELETKLDQLSNRAAAVNSSLDRLQQQQALPAMDFAATWSPTRPA